MYKIALSLLLCSLTIVAYSSLSSAHLYTKQISSQTSSQDTNSTKSSPQEYKRYLIESGIIEYRLTGSQVGSETVYFDKWGMREAKYTSTEIKVGKQIRRSNRLILMNEEYIYTIDLDNKMGTRIKKPLTNLAASEAVIKQLGGEKVGSEEVAGRVCDVWEIKKLATKSWIWKAIVLKTEVKLPGSATVSTVVKIEEGVTIAPEKFILPADIKIIDHFSSSK
ncbi:MAG: hypothetical protein AB1489_18475 [Acidobacteriota bacterium]